MAGKRDRLRLAMGSSGLGVGEVGIGLSGGFGMTTLGGGTGGSVLVGKAYRS